MKSNLSYDENWLFKLFSLQVWGALLFTLLLLSTAELITIHLKCRNKKIGSKLILQILPNYFFYFAGIFSNQSIKFEIHSYIF